MTSRILDAQMALEMPLAGVRLIEASAGTGKTYTIANLYLRHILEGRTPAEILVVSFTRAATAELQQRIHARLYETLQAFETGSNPDDEFMQLLLRRYESLDGDAREQQRRRLQHALRSLDEAMIATIHGFCNAALKDHALLSGRQFEFEVVAEDHDYWEHALKDWWRRTSYPLATPEWSLLDEALGGLPGLLQIHRELRPHPRDRILPMVETPLAQLLDEHREATTDSDGFDALLQNLRARALVEARDFARPRVAAAKEAQARIAYQDQLDQLLEALEHDPEARLAARLRERFPVAMIDEFQDTDSVQFDIFRILYFDSNRSSLTLIGDPKQAIYGFRGGDIFAYIGARESTSLEVLALDTNWRSQAGVVSAVNRLFMRRSNPFIYAPAITFLPARPAPTAGATSLALGGRTTAPLTLWQLPSRDDGSTLTAGDTRPLVAATVAAEVSRLLDPDSRASVDSRPLQSGDIAILVRTNDEGNEVRHSLASAGIRSISIGNAGVFESEQAAGLYDLICAIAWPGDESWLRRARSSSLFGLDYLALADEIDDDARWQHWIDALRSLHQTWIEHGFIAMFQQLLETLDIADSLARRPDAERALTNLLQLGELLQRQSRIAPGMDALIGWMREQMDGGAGEEAELRLESEADLVKVVTIHKSKGLEYPVVFLPYAWRCRTLKRNAPLQRFHDDTYQACADLGSEAREQNFLVAEKERLAEDLRLLYVAVTRARSKLYLAWGDVGSGRRAGRPASTALGYLLHPGQDAQDLESAPPWAFDDSAGMRDQLQAFADAADEIELVDLPAPIATRATAGDASLPQEVSARRFGRSLGPIWRINSFSGLTRDVHQAPLAGEAAAQGDPILDFPAGSHVGLLLHELLEELDFRGDLRARAEALISRKAPLYGIEGESRWQTLADWLELIVATDLDGDGLRLDGLAGDRRLNEMKFDFALDDFDIDALNRLMQDGTQLSLQPISAARFRGLLTGIVDLVFEHDGKFYLADYKSNFLGARLEDYRPTALARAMLERRYDLQALLYSVALQRYLRQRLADYSHARHFGGYYYLFLRAMRPASGPRFGVHFERPSMARLDALDELFAFTPGGGGAL